MMFEDWASGIDPVYKKAGPTQNELAARQIVMPYGPMTTTRNVTPYGLMMRKAIADGLNVGAKGPRSYSKTGR